MKMEMKAMSENVNTRKWNTHILTFPFASMSIIDKCSSQYMEAMQGNPIGIKINPTAPVGYGSVYSDPNGRVSMEGNPGGIVGIADHIQVFQSGMENQEVERTRIPY